MSNFDTVAYLTALLGPPDEEREGDEVVDACATREVAWWSGLANIEAIFYEDGDERIAYDDACECLVYRSERREWEAAVRFLGECALIDMRDNGELEDDDD